MWLKGFYKRVKCSNNINRNVDVKFFFVVFIVFGNWVSFLWLSIVIVKFMIKYNYGVC